jgi:hypothetical protein
MGLVTFCLIALVAFRFTQHRKSADPKATSLTRPLMAMLLVGAIFVLAAASLGMKESADLQKLLVGAVISLGSAAGAYYFASSGASEARRDMLQFNLGRAKVPELEGKTVREAQALIAGTSFALKLPSPAPDADGIVVKQDPPAGTDTGGSEQIRIVETAKPPVVKRVEPGHGKGGEKIAVRGSGFTGATAVSFDKTSATMSVDSDQQISATTPSTLSGTVHVIVTTPAGTSQPSPDSQFTIDE